MYFHNVVGTGSYTTSTTNMYHKDRFYLHSTISQVSIKVISNCSISSSVVVEEVVEVVEPPLFLLERMCCTKLSWEET